MVGRQLVHRIVFPAFLPGRPDPELLAESCNLPGLGDPSNGADAATDEVDQALGNQRAPFMGVSEQLSHGHGGGGDGSNLPKVIDLLGREDVFHKEHANGLHAPGELQGQRRRQVLVDVV